MKKIILCLICFMFISCSQSEPISEIDKKITYWIGLLQTGEAVKKKFPHVESGYIYVAEGKTVLVEETTSIKYEKGVTFGVLLENIPNNVLVGATWEYPTSLNLNTTTSLPKIGYLSNRQLAWRISEGELPGIYKLKIYLNEKLSRTVVFNVI